MKIPRTIIAEIAAHAEAEKPIEACGYLAGSGEQVAKLFRLTNLDQSPEHFSFDAKEQFRVTKEARLAGLRLLAVYHSHPASPARLSEEDKRLTFDPNIIYVIHSLLNHETKAFDAENNPVALEVV